jgi:hypothetical protein
MLPFFSKNDLTTTFKEVQPEIPDDPISSPSSLQLSSVDFNQSCPLVTLIDTFGDHWGWF